MKGFPAHSPQPTKHLLILDWICQLTVWNESGWQWSARERALNVAIQTSESIRNRFENESPMVRLKKGVPDGID